MKQIILSSTIPEFTWLVIDDFIEKYGLASLSQKGNKAPQIQKVPKNFEIYQAFGYKI